MIRGLVITIEANFFTVVSPNGTALCTLRATLKKSGQIVKVGDQVWLDNPEDERPVIAQVLPRRNELHRPAIANVEQLLIVMAAQEPTFLSLMADRLLLHAAYHDIQPLLCINKADLMVPEQADWLLKTYQQLGYPLLFVSAREGLGLNELKHHLQGKITVLAGPSGVGKSSLVNALQPGLALQTGEVNEKLGLGKHTTRQVTLFSIQEGAQQGWLADTPGFQVLDVPALAPQDLGFHYPEFKPWLGQCAYLDCEHAQEPGCVIQLQFAETTSRYQNYLTLLAELHQYKKSQKKISQKQEQRTKQQDAGQNQQKTLIKLGAVHRAPSRRNQKQQLAALEDLTDQDDL